MPLTTPQQQAVDLAASDRLRFASATNYSFEIDTPNGVVDFAGLVKELRYSGEDPKEGKPACVLEATIAARLTNIELENCRLDYLVGSERIPGFRGRVVYADVKGHYTELIAATGSYEAEDTPLGDADDPEWELIGEMPSVVAYDVLSPLYPYYEGIEIARKEKPRIYRIDDDALQWTDSVSDALGVVREEGKLAIFDTPLNVATGQTTNPTSVTDEEPLWTFVEGRDFKEGELSVSSVNEKRYARVEVYRVPEDGAPVSVADAKIDNHGMAVNPRSTLLLEHTDEDTETAFDMAYREAVARGENLLKLEWSPVYTPFFLHQGHVVAVEGREITRDAVIVRDYRVRIASYVHDPEEKVSSFVAVGTRVAERLEAKAPRIQIPAATGAVRALWGRDYRGNYRLNTSLPWVRVEGDRVIVDTEVAALYGVGAWLDERRRRVVVSDRVEPSVFSNWGQTDIYFGSETLDVSFSELP